MRGERWIDEKVIQAMQRRRISTIMVRLEQIKRDGYDITCAVFVEDCKESAQMTYSILDKTVRHDPLPEGYEYCTSHIGHAKRALERMVKKGHIEPRTTVMWY